MLEADRLRTRDADRDAMSFSNLRQIGTVRLDRIWF